MFSWISLTGAAHRRRLLRVMTTACLATTLLASCVSNKGVPEFQVYRQTFEATETTVRSVIDAFEPVERAKSIQAMRTQGYSPLRYLAEKPDAQERVDAVQRIRDNAGFDPNFHVVDAVYFAVGQSPPATAAFLNALEVVRAYNDVLQAYIEGRAFDEIEGQLAGLQRSLEGFLESVGAASQLAGVVLPVGEALGTAVQMVKNALRAGQRAAFRNAIREIGPIIDSEILLRMRDAAPSMFRLLSRSAQGAATDAADDGDTAERDRQVAIVENYRTVMSNWVVSLDASRTALQRTVAATQEEDTPASLLGDLILTVDTVSAMARGTRTLLGEIRTAR